MKMRGSSNAAGTKNVWSGTLMIRLLHDLMSAPFKTTIEHNKMMTLFLDSELKILRGSLLECIRPQELRWFVDVNVLGSYVKTDWAE